MQPSPRRRFPLELSRNGLVRRLSMLLGCGLGAAMPQRRKRLEAGEKAKNWLDRMS